MTRRVRPAPAFLAAVLALGGVLATATAASAHDRLESTSPKQGSSVASPPATITLTYNNPIFKLGSKVQVIGPAGDVVTGQPSFEEREVTQAIRPDAPAGKYTVRWQVTSSDGHPIAGTWTFTVANAATTATTAAPTGETTTAAPTAEATPTPTATEGVSATGDPAAESSSTGLVIGVTAVAAVVLLGAAGVVAWTSRRRPD